MNMLKRILVLKLSIKRMEGKVVLAMWGLIVQKELI